jgi:hypothetical protein
MSDWHRIIVAALVLLAITVVHELGHAATGLALGMRLRAFIAGPFQWRIREGRWDFQFKPTGILLPEGAAGVVPTTADFSRAHSLIVSAAGVFANLATGLIALWAASAARAWGFLALFGAWSVTQGAMNLLPLRVAGSYSDGAMMYQLLSGGPWGDFHRSLAVVGSSLVTPMRPRDFDIATLQRAAKGIAQGPQGLLLRLCAYTCFFDQDRIPEAGEMLREAALVYPQCAAEIPAELHTDLVFGSAYVLCDAKAAREWWTRMEAKNPTRFNADYWRAASALHWIEGDLKAADEAWEKSNAEAQQLPKAGAYEFERYCCNKLRVALDDVPATG